MHTVPLSSQDSAAAQGGVGTFLPLYLRLLETARDALYQGGRAEGRQGPSPPPDLFTRAFMDPTDPTTIFVTQPPGAAEQPRIQQGYVYDSKKND